MLGFFVLLAVIAVIVVMAKCGFFRSLFFSVISGTGLLLAIHFTSLISGLALPVNPVSIITAALGGAPAVGAMLVMRFLL